MISHSLRARLLTLERRIKDVVCERSLITAVNATAIYFFARIHAASVIAVAHYGEPRTDEPLLRACTRASHKLVDRFGRETIRRCEEEFEQLGAGGPGRHIMKHPSLRPEIVVLLDRDLSGRTSLSRALARAPVWLLKFTGVERDADILGFRLRDLSGAPMLGRDALLDRARWPCLPECTIDAGVPYDEAADRPLTTQLLMDLNVWSGRPFYRDGRFCILG